MRISFSFFILFLLVISAQASPNGDAPNEAVLKDEFATLSKSLPSGDLNNSFCYAADAHNFSQLRGANTDLNVRLASVSKVITSFWALSELGPHFRYQTYIAWDAKSKHLHISGAKDPFMGQQALMYILSELNRMKIYDIDTITFDKNFLVYEFADVKSYYESNVGSQTDPAIADIQITIQKYFNSKNWSKSLARTYRLLREQAQDAHYEMQPSISMHVKNVILDNQNSLASDPKALHFIYNSEELYRYLKHMNTFSINYAANIIFRALGGRDPFNQFLQSKLGIAPGAISMYTGSGLEFYLDGEAGQQRVDNESDCETVLKVIASLGEELKKSKFGIEDLLLVAGIDKGTWEGTDESKEIVAAKTGTLIEIPVANLVGMAKTAEGIFYFGVFFQMKDAKEMNAAHDAQNTMVDEIILKNGGRAKNPLVSSAKVFLPFGTSIQRFVQPAIQ